MVTLIEPQVASYLGHLAAMLHDHGLLEADVLGDKFRISQIKFEYGDEEQPETLAFDGLGNLVVVVEP